MIPERLKPFTTPQPVLDDGHVQLIDCMGNDLAIVDAARVSFFGHSSEHTDAQNRNLLRYLMRSGHTTPFEMCELKIRVRVPMDAWRQWIRHRTANVNESSTRYAPAINSMQKVTEWRSQSKDNKQGSTGLVTEWPDPNDWDHEDKGDMDTAPTYLSQRETDLQGFAREVYEERLAFGVAKEQARKDLPLSTYTSAYWKIDLHNLFHFLRLRLDSHAQAEIRAFAQAIAEIVKVWVPWAWEAFSDYRLDGMYITAKEIEVIQGVIGHLANMDFDQEKLSRTLKMLPDKIGTSREQKELIAKMNRLLLPR